MCGQPIPDKALRGTFHKTLREAFSSKLVSAHKDNAGGEPSIEVGWVKAGTASRDKKREKAPRGERGASSSPFLSLCSGTSAAR